MALSLFTSKFSSLDDLSIAFFLHHFPALTLVLRTAKRLNLEKLMIYANLNFVRKNIDKVPKWVKKKLKLPDGHCTLTC